jgi:serine/threonine protein kinase
MSMNQNLSENKIKENIKNVNYTIPFNLSNNCKDLITKILVKNPDLRLSL